MLWRAQTLQRYQSKRHATAVAGSRPTGAIHRNLAKYPLGGSSGAERGSREPGGAIRTGIIAAAITFHQETSDVRPDLMVDAEGTRRYLRPCGFTEAQIDEIIADARADQPSSIRKRCRVSTCMLQMPTCMLRSQHAILQKSHVNICGRVLHDVAKLQHDVAKFQHGVSNIRTWRFKTPNMHVTDMNINVTDTSMHVTDANMGKSQFI